MAGDSRWNLIKQGAEAKLYTGAYLGQPAIMKVCLVDPYVDGSSPLPPGLPCVQVKLHCLHVREF